MLFEGFKLMVMGMGTVMLFLIVMIFCIQFISWMSRHVTLAEQKQVEGNRNKFSSSVSDQIPIAVISAAIAAYEAEWD